MTIPKKKKAIERAARALFQRFGVQRVTVEEVCRSAEVSKGTFYKYFPNKTELVKYILERMTDHALERTEAIDRLSVPFPEKVRMLVDDQLEATRRQSDAFLDDYFHSDDAELQAYARSLTASAHRRFLLFITEAQRRGEVRPELKPEFVLAVLGKFNDLAADEALRAEYPGWVELTEEIMGFLFYGLMGSPGAPHPPPASG